MKKLLTAFALLMLNCGWLMAQNPIIRDQFTADPTARVFNNKVYLYPSHDIVPPEGQRQDWFCMEDYHVFSSENLTDWTDHGMIVTQNKVPWVRPNSYSMWAPDCVERNGKYYFYFPSTPAGSMRGFGVGVAIADSPEGPFIPEPEPIKGINGIDPCVLLASDGNAYIFWGAGRCAKLKDNMKELADDNPKETVKWGDREFEMLGVNCLKGLPSRQAEGPFAFEYNGNYYLTYPYVRENTEVLGYAMSKNPMGPYEYKGLIMAEHANGCWTNHHSIVNYKGQWYLFYHHNAYSPKDDKRRSVQIEKLFFNPDGTIQEVKPTLRGVGISNAFERIQIDRYSAISETGASIEFQDTVNTFKGWNTLLTDGGWIQYNDVKFDVEPQMVLVNACSEKGAVVRILVGKECVAKVKIPARGHFESTIQKLTKKISPATSDIRVELESGSALIDYIQFCAQMPVVQTKFTADPAPMVYDGQVFLYTTHDEDDARGYEFKMKDWLLYTSTDMVNWQDRGAVASLKDFKWYDGDNGAWAEQVIERNGKFYMYCPIHGHGIGVLVADSPYGPFHDPIGQPLVWQKEHWYDIDPSVWIDDDGQAYMYWGNPHTYYIKLNEDMISTSGEIQQLPHIKDYQEGPWIYKKDSNYYLAFASTCCPEGIGYAMSDKITGPWQYKGHIMNHTYKTRGNHPGIIDYKGRSYVFGLNYDLLRLITDEHSERRSVSCAEMRYNADGTIQELPYFRENVLNPVATFNPYQKVEAETMSWGFGLKTVESATFPKSIQLCNIDDGETLTLRNVDFGKKGAKKFMASVASAKKGSTIEVHLDNADGPLVGTLALSGTRKATCKLKNPSGIHDLVFVFKGNAKTDLFIWDWWQMM
jgi:beta-xylosidase